MSIYDQAVWQYKSQGDCDIYSGTGQHTISADAEPARSSNWTAWLPVRHWQDGWPGFMTTDDGPYLRVDTSKLLGYFRKLGPKQRLKCNVFIDLPNYCSRANYIRRSRTIQREEINLPGLSSFKEQISNLFLEFRFASYAQFRKNGSVCFPRPGKKC